MGVIFISLLLERVWMIYRMSLSLILSDVIVKYSKYQIILDNVTEFPCTNLSCCYNYLKHVKFVTH